MRSWLILFICGVSVGSVSKVPSTSDADLDDILGSWESEHNLDPSVADQNECDLDMNCTNIGA